MRSSWRSETQTHRRRRPYTDRGRDWSDAATSQGHLGPPEAGRGRKNPYLGPSERDKSAVTLILNF